MSGMAPGYKELEQRGHRLAERAREARAEAQGEAAQQTTASGGFGGERLAQETTGKRFDGQEGRGVRGRRGGSAWIQGCVSCRPPARRPASPLIPSPTTSALPLVFFLTLQDPWAAIQRAAQRPGC